MAHYDFVNWRNDDEGKQYEAGESSIYTGTNMKKGETKIVNIYAYWQPSHTENYSVEGKLTESFETFEQTPVLVYSYKPSDEEDYKFAGWYSSDKSAEDRIDEEAAYGAPEITKEADSATVEDSYAWWQPSLTVGYHEFDDEPQYVKDFNKVTIYDAQVKNLNTYTYLQFAGWYDGEGNRIGEDEEYAAPDLTYMKEGAASEEVYAYWQPSVTINYFKHRNGELIAAVERFEQMDSIGEEAEKNETIRSGIETKTNITFAGWYYMDTAQQQDTKPAAADPADDSEEGTGMRLLSSDSAAEDEAKPGYADGQNVTDEIIEKLAVTRDRVVQAVVNVYAKFVTSITGKKVWNDDQNRDGLRPGSISMELLRNGEAVEGRVLTLSEENEWTGLFEDLEAYDDDGNLIIYSLREAESPEGYEAAEPEETRNEDGVLTGITITNSHEPEKISFTIEKYWEDADDQDKLRPDSIVVTVYENGEKLENYTIRGEEDWKYLVEDVNRYYDHGKDIEYTVAEESVDGYESQISGSAAEGFRVTNTHTVKPEPQPEPEPEPEPQPEPQPQPKPQPQPEPAPAPAPAPTPVPETVVIPDAAVPTAAMPAMAVLGETREAVQEAAAVLGAVRESRAVKGAIRTGDGAHAPEAAAMAAAALLGIVAQLILRKANKKEDK